MRIGAQWGGVVAAGVALVALGRAATPSPSSRTERAVGQRSGQALDQAGLNIQVSLGATPDQLLQVDRMENGGDSFTPQMASAACPRRRWSSTCIRVMASRSRASSSRATPTIRSSWPSRSGGTGRSTSVVGRRHPLRPRRPARPALRVRSGSRRRRQACTGRAGPGRQVPARAGRPGRGQMGVHRPAAARPLLKLGGLDAAPAMPAVQGHSSRPARSTRSALSRTPAIRTAATTAAAPSTGSPSRRAPSCGSCRPTCPIWWEALPGASGMAVR